MVVESKRTDQLSSADSPIPLSVSEQLNCLLTYGANVPAGTVDNAELPPWFDYKKFCRGQQYFHNNYYALFVAKLCGLLSILAIPSILNVLVLTQKSSDPPSAFRRYLATLTHMLDWYNNDLLDPCSRAFHSLHGVKTRHCTASKKAVRAGLGAISQLDMALTQFGFMGFGLLLPHELGLVGSLQDQEGFIHFWRTVGHMLGIEERFNLCHADLAETRLLCQGLLEQVFVPALQDPPPHFNKMARTLLDGMWAMVPFLETDAFLSFTFKLAGVKHKYQLHMYARATLALQRFVHAVALHSSLLAWLVRPILNFNMWLAVWLTQRYALLAHLAWGQSVLK